MIKLITWLGIAAVAGAQEPPRGDGRLVMVDVVVRDKTGPVTGLTKDDFTVLDKGKPQSIAVFAAADRPSDGSAKPISPRVGNNKMTRRGQPVKSATVILYDRLNTPAEDQAFVRKQVLTTLASLKETDVFAFYSLGRSLVPVHDFTEDAASLIHAATRLNAGQSQPAPADPDEQAMQKSLEEALQTQQGTQMTFRVATTAQALQSVTRHLAGIPGRKSVVWITRTFPLTFGADVNRRGELERELNAPIVMLQEENIAVYPMNPGGVGKGFSDSTTSGTDSAPEGRLMPRSNAAVATNTDAISENSTMENLAKATGGLAFYNINEISSEVHDVMAEADGTYRLGFYPDAKLDGKPHDLGVKVKASSGALRFRKKYVASKEEPRFQTPPVPELAADPLDATAIALAGYAEPDPDHPRSQKVDVSVNVNDLKMTRDGGHWSGAFELGFWVQSPAGSNGRTRAYNLNLSDDQLRKAQTAGLIVSNTIDLGNQPVSLRIVVRDKTSGAAGAVHIPLAAN